MHVPWAMSFVAVSRGNCQLIKAWQRNISLLFPPCIVLLRRKTTIFAEYNQQDATFHNLFISVRRSTCFRRFFPSIIRSSKLHIQRQVFVRPILVPAASLARLAAGIGWNWLKLVPPSTQHQPAATSVDNTRSCSYSDMLLMMGENIARNVYSRL